MKNPRLLQYCIGTVMLATVGVSLYVDGGMSKDAISGLLLAVSTLAMLDAQIPGKDGVKPITSRMTVALGSMLMLFGVEFLPKLMAP